MSGSGSGTPAVSSFVPTAAEVVARFPEFENISDIRIDMFIAEAGRSVDSSWLDADRKIAHLLLTAHLMATEGLLNPAGASPAGAVTGMLQSESLGDASWSYGDRSKSSSGDDPDLMSTPYGVRFARMRRGNHAGPLVV